MNSQQKHKHQQQTLGGLPPCGRTCSDGQRGVVDAYGDSQPHRTKASKSDENSGVKGGRLGGRRVASGGHPMCVFVVSVSCLPTPVCRRKELEFLRHSAPCLLAIPLHFAQPYRISRAGDATLWLEGKDHVHASAILPATLSKPLRLQLASTTTREAKQTGPTYVCCLMFCVLLATRPLVRARPSPAGWTIVTTRPHAKQRTNTIDLQCRRRCIGFAWLGPVALCPRRLPTQCLLSVVLLVVGYAISGCHALAE